MCEMLFILRSAAMYKMHNKKYRNSKMPLKYDRGSSEMYKADNKRCINCENVEQNVKIISEYAEKCKCKI